VRLSISPLLKLRWLAIILLIPAVEVLALSIYFDSAVLNALSGWPSWLLSQSSDIARIGLASVGTFALIAVPQHQILAADLAGYSNRHRCGVWLAGHFLSIGVFCLVTSEVIEQGALHEGKLSSALIAGWTTLGLASIASLAFSLAPVGFWSAFLRTQSKAIVAAMIVGVLAWAGGLLAQQLWRPLADLTFLLVDHLLRVAGIDLVEGAGQGVIGTQAFLVKVAPECSGYEGIALVCVFVAVYLWLTRHDLRLPQAFMLLPIGVLAVWLANVLRIAALVLIGSYVSPEVAAKGFHSQAGWLGFILTALALVALAHKARLFSLAKGPSSTVLAPHAQLATALLAPFLVLLMTKMISAALSAEFELLYPVQVCATGATLWYFRKAYAGFGFGGSWQAVLIGTAVFVLWVQLDAPRPDLLADAWATEDIPLGVAVIWVLFGLAGSVLAVPLAEEFAFRGYLIRKLVSSEFEKVASGKFTWSSFLLTSVLFGLLHHSWLAGTIAGMGYALALYCKGRIGDAVVAHATTNLLLAAYVLLFDAWGPWQ
jgi:exosortase E/protease (VPEID-CTERM system)